MILMKVKEIAKANEGEYTFGSSHYLSMTKCYFTKEKWFYKENYPKTLHIRRALYKKKSENFENLLKIFLKVFKPLRYSSWCT